MPKPSAKRSSRSRLKTLPLTSHQRKTLKTWLANDGVIRKTARLLDRDKNLVKDELRFALVKLGCPTDFAKALKQLRGKHR
jgi:hypothetical protein